MIAFLPVSAEEWTDSSTEVLNGQCNLGNIWSQIKVETSDDDIIAAATSAGNSFTADLQSEAGLVTSNQTNIGSVGAETRATIHNPVGDVAVSSAAIGNIATVTSYENYLDTYSAQDNDGDIYANTRVTVGNANGHGVEATATAIGNSYTAGHNWGYGDTVSYSSQVNSGNVTAQSKVTIGNAGKVSAIATAIGNNAHVSNGN
jgi:hypothetical protein